MVKFSIITVTFNCRSSIERTLQSVLSQQGVELEYILIDAASTDGTVDLIKQYAAEDCRVRWISEPDQGISDAFNKGIKLAAGTVVGILNSDDTYTAGALAKVARLFIQNPDCAVAHGDMLRLNAAGAPLFRLTPEADIGRAVWQRMPIYHPTTFVAREIYHEVGLFDVGLKTSMDYDLILRISRGAYRFCYLPEILAEMPYGGVSERRLLRRLQEGFIIRTRYGFPRYKACCLFAWGLLKGSVKAVLTHTGLSRILTLLPNVSRY